MNPNNETFIVAVDEQYPVFKFVKESEAYPGTVSIEVDPATVERWQAAIDAYEDVRAEIAARVTAVTGETYPEFE